MSSIRAVWKFDLAGGDAKPVDKFEASLDLTVGAEIISVEYQARAALVVGEDGVPRPVLAHALVLWALVDPEEKATTKRRIFGTTTGRPFDAKRLAGARFLGSGSTVGAQHVCHVWEIDVSVPEGM